MQLRRADTTLGDDQELANVTYNDKYVVVYDFGSVGTFGSKESGRAQVDTLQSTRLPLPSSLCWSKTYTLLG